MKIKNKNKGILIWITGLSGAGKTSLAKGIKNKIAKSYGKTIILNGDDLRKIFDLKRYDRKARLNYGRKYCKFLKFLTDQNVNVIFFSGSSQDTVFFTDNLHMPKKKR